MPIDGVSYQIAMIKNDKIVRCVFDKTNESGLGWVFEADPEQPLNMKKKSGLWIRKGKTWLVKLTKMERSLS
jgi:hypothetical protein